MITKQSARILIAIIHLL